MIIVECVDGRFIEVDTISFRVGPEGALCCSEKENIAIFPAGRWIGAYRKGKTRLLTKDEAKSLNPPKEK